MAEPAAAGSIARNAASLLVARGAGTAVSFAFGIYIARSLGVAEFGRYSLLMAVYTLLTIFVHLGLESLLVREISRAREEAGRYFRAALGVKAASALLCLGALAAVARLYPPARPLALPLILLGLVLVLDAISDVIAALFQAHQRFGEPSSLGLLGGFLFAVAGSAALFMGGRTTALIACLAGAKLVQVLAGWAVARLRLGDALRSASPVTAAFSLGLLAAALPFFLSKLFAILYLRVDMLMIGSLVGEEPVGLYAAAYKFVNVATAAAAALAAALFPVMASAAAHSIVRFRALFGESVRVMLVTGTLVSALVWIGAGELLALLFGQGYAAGAPAARLLAWTIVALFVNLIFSNALLSMDRERYAVGVGAFALMVNVGLNLMWIPAFREWGAAAATLISEAVVACAYMAALMRAGLIRIDPGSGLKFLAAVAALLSPALLWPEVSVFVTGAAGGALYVAALFLMRLLTPDDLSRVRGLFAAPGSAA